MSTTTNVPQVKINIMTQEQYNNVDPLATNELYMITDAPGELPSQSGQSGKFLTTNGSSASWENVDKLPTQTGHSGEVLTTNGATTSWTTAGTVVEIREWGGNE